MESENLILQLPDRTVNALVKRSAQRRRTLSVQVKRDGSVTFNIPLRTSKKALHEFATSKQSWLFIQLQKAQARQMERADKQDIVQFLGIDYPLHIEASPLLRTGGFCDLTDKFTVQIPANVLPAKQSTHVKRLLAKWYQKQAATLFNDRVAFFAAQLNVTPGTIKMRDTKSRWGSCDRHGNLNLNWRIIMSPLELVDYLIVHELCHIVYFNHSPQFWQLVASILPDYQQRRAALKKRDTRT